MKLEIEEIGQDRYALYGMISNAFWVESVLRVVAVDGGLGGLSLVEERVTPPYLKTYGGPGEDTPDAWMQAFDLSR